MGLHDRRPECRLRSESDQTGQVVELPLMAEAVEKVCVGLFSGIELEMHSQGATHSKKHSAKCRFGRNAVERDRVPNFRCWLQAADWLAANYVGFTARSRPQGVRYRCLT